jgi:hypothetical protein
MLSITTHQWICASTYIVLEELLVQVERVMPGLWLRNKRYSSRCWLSRLTVLIHSNLVRHAISKMAGHASAVSRLRVTAQQLAPLVPFYHVSYVDLYLVSRLGLLKALGCTCTTEGRLYAHVLRMAGLSVFWLLELATVFSISPSTPSTPST